MYASASSAAWTSSVSIGSSIRWSSRRICCVSFTVFGRRYKGLLDSLLLFTVFLGGVSADLGLLEDFLSAGRLLVADCFLRDWTFSGCNCLDLFLFGNRSLLSCFVFLDFTIFVGRDATWGGWLLSPGPVIAHISSGSSRRKTTTGWNSGPQMSIGGGSTYINTVSSFVITTAENASYLLDRVFFLTKNLVRGWKFLLF